MAMPFRKPWGIQDGRESLQRDGARTSFTSRQSSQKTNDLPNSLCAFPQVMFRIKSVSYSNSTVEDLRLARREAKAYAIDAIIF